MAIIRVLAIVVGDDNTTFYKEDGSTFDLPSSDPRLGKIIETATPAIAAGQVAHIDFESVQTTHYKQFEEKTNGLVRLFRVAKKVVSHIFKDPHDPENKPAPQTIGTVPVVTNGQPAVAPAAPVPVPAPDAPAPVNEPVAIEPQPEVVAKTEKLTNAASEILSKAQSVNDEKFTDDETTDDDTIIAVVKDEKGEDVIIPGMENLQAHMALALKLGSTTGVENFLKRIAPVIAKRGHSIDDLLRFMVKNDMPIADDGCLIAFKTLNRRGNHNDGQYVDIHSGNVHQRVGSKVFMAEGLVDPNRRNECSNGLHVARRAYVGGFRGSHGVMCIIKVAPEDAIAVPAYDGNKMRVCGYHIVADVPASDHNFVYSNQPIPKDSETAKLLGAIIKGKHIGVIEHVEIGGARGGNLRIQKLQSEATDRKQLQEAKQEAKTAVPIASIDDKKDGAFTGSVDAKDVAKNVAAAKAQAGTSKAAQARVLFEGKNYVELLAFKKSAKKGWSALGFNATEEALITSHAAPAAKPAPAAQPVAKPVTTPPASAAEPEKPKIPNAKTKAAMRDVKAGKTTKTGTVENTMAELNKKDEPKMTGTRAEVARALFDQATGTGSAAGKAPDKSRWGSLWQHRKECKKGWDLLGFTPKEIERIKTNKPDHI